MTTLALPPGFAGLLQQMPDQSQLGKAKRPRGRRISWAPGDKLCQTRLFAAEDAPALSGTLQDQLQAKQARNLHIFNSIARSQSFDAPPGFGGVSTKSKPDPVALAAFEPEIFWSPPSEVKLDPTWLVVAGGASKEIGFQNRREVRLLEAVYPRPSSIPDNPAEPLEAQEPYDDSSTPQIPLVPLEEDDLPDVTDLSTLPSRPRFLSPGSPDQGTGTRMILPNASVMQNYGPRKSNLHTRDSLPGPMHETSHISKESWRSSFINQSSDPLGCRPLPTGLLSSDPSPSNRNGVGPDIAAAAAAAFSALSKSKELGSMIDNDLLIQILKDPSLMKTLTNKGSFTLANSKLERSPSEDLNRLSRGPEKIDQGTHWMSPSSTSYRSIPAEGKEARVRIGEPYPNGGERLQRISGSNGGSSAFTPVILGNGQQFAELVNGRLGSGNITRPSLSTSAVPGFVNGNANTTLPTGFRNKFVAQQASQIGPTPSRPLSRHDEQYYKSLILQHGCKTADDDDHGRSGADNSQGKNGAGPSISYSTWYDRDEVDGARPDKNERDLKDTERNGMGPSLAYGTRAKSRKACIYFGTSRGCRNGDNCAFVHAMIGSEKLRAERMRNEAIPVQYAKRLKVDG